MATFIERIWHPTDASALSRRDKVPGRYLAYVPDELAVALPAVGPDAEIAATDALVALGRADERIGDRGGLLTHLLLRSEGISSSWIEGNRISPKRLAIAEVLSNGGRVARDVLATIHATEEAIVSLADRSKPISVDDFVRIQHLIEPRLDKGFRQQQNWVGGTGYSPLRADFIPPPETEVERLLLNLAEFATVTSGNPVIRAAIAHAQFETIHPFIDGNGRTGRALIHAILRRGDAVRNIIVPISAVFAAHTPAYIAGLTDFRREPQNLDAWILAFAEAIERAARISVELVHSIEDLDATLLDELFAARKREGKRPIQPRANSVLLKILRNLAQSPVVTGASVAREFGVSLAAAHKALGDLTDAGILNRSKDHKGKTICWASDRHFGLIEGLDAS